MLSWGWAFYEFNCHGPNPIYLKWAIGWAFSDQHGSDPIQQNPTQPPNTLATKPISNLYRQDTFIIFFSFITEVSWPLKST